MPTAPPDAELDPILTKVDRYYSDKLAQHGPVPGGVDWNGLESQELRFRQLLEVCDFAKGFSINDLGCGYGALLDYIRKMGWQVEYRGFDVSEAMVMEATRIHADASNARFVVAAKADEPADYTVASGIFNVCLDVNKTEWQKYMMMTLDEMDLASKKGFAFNCLTSYSDASRMRDYLHYADPCMLFDICKRKYSKNVALVHDYGLYEFTMLVRKDV